jgi:predicted porin
MKKKALALAVAGALGAPALALAQTSTVQIYGQARIDYNLTDQGAGLRRVDAFSTYDSYIGLRGEEKLGGGLSAWFQCESTFAPNGEGPGNGWCSRNTGVGFKGGFGNVFVGNWDTPFKIVAGSVYLPFSTSGSFGNASLLHNGSASNVGNGLLAAGVGAAPAPLGAGTGANENAGFSRRQLNLISYHSPTWAGFQVMAAYSATDESTPLTPLAAGPNGKPRLYSLGGTYTAGPLYLGLGYEQHKDYSPAGTAFAAPGAVGYRSGKDRSWEAIAAYTFGPVRVGAAYTNTKYEVADPAIVGANRDLRYRAWALYGDWRIVGPHSLRLGYVSAGDTKGNSTVNVNNLTAPLTAAGLAINDTGAQLYLIQYAYAFSKRTELNFGYAKLANDRNSRHVLQSLQARNTCQGVPGAAATVPPGAASCDRDQNAWVVGVIHRF